MPYENKIYRKADPVPPGAARPPIYGDGFGFSDPTSGIGCVYYFVTIPSTIPGMPPKTQRMKKCPPDWTPTPAPAPAFLPVRSMGSDTTDTPRPSPPSTGGGGGKSEKCTWKRIEYLIDPMRPESGTAFESVCVTGST